MTKPKFVDLTEGLGVSDKYYLAEITTLYAFLAISPESGEGIVAEQIGNVMFPFVCSDKARVDSLKPMAEKIAQRTGFKIKLVKFTNREVIDEF